MKTQRKLRSILSLFLFTWLFSQPLNSLSQGFEHEAYLPLVLSPARVQYQANAPYFDVADVIESEHFPEMAIFWFGKVTSYDNMTDVRVAYGNTGLFVYVAVYDRLHWYDTTPTVPELQQWDGITLYVNTAGAVGTVPSPTSYRMDSQINANPANRQPYQAAFQGNNTNWTQITFPFTTLVGQRGDGGLNTGLDNRGWAITYKIPFSSFGLAGKPANGTEWGFAVAMHDRDTSNGSIFLETSWPPEVNFSKPNTWGGLRYGLPQYNPPPVPQVGTVTIRQSSTVQTPDGDVGGHFTCGDNIDFWSEWGNTVYYTNSDGSQVGDLNVQNQADIADWPCFSKYFVTFPLDAIPPGKVILSASVTLHHFGNSGDIFSQDPGQTPFPSPIQVLTSDRDFNEQTLNWNNAPLALENISTLWIDPIPLPPWPGIPRTWDISYALAQAYESNIPLRLAFYSADNNYHSGKYFVSADTGDWNAAGRPTIVITYGNP